MTRLAILALSFVTATNAQAGIVTDAPLSPSRWVIVEIDGNLPVRTNITSTPFSVIARESSTGGRPTEQPERSGDYFFASTMPIEQWRFDFEFGFGFDFPIPMNQHFQYHDLRDLPIAEEVRMTAGDIFEEDGSWFQRWTYAPQGGDAVERIVQFVPEPGTATLLACFGGVALIAGLSWKKAPPLKSTSRLNAAAQIVLDDRYACRGNSRARGAQPQ